MAEYGQGMVRPGVWSESGWAAGYVDRQCRIAKTLQALHTNLSSFWETHSWDSDEDRATLAQMYVNTTADFQTAWVTTGTHVSMPIALRVITEPLPPSCQLCDEPNPHTHQDRWR